MKFLVAVNDRLEALGSMTALQLLERAVVGAAQTAQKRWVQVASKSGAPQSYVDGVRNAEITVTESAVEGTSARVAVKIQNAMSGSKFVDSGNAAFHLPSRISWPSRKTKVDSKGRMYITVPLKAAGASAATAATVSATKAVQRVGRRLPARRVKSGAGLGSVPGLIFRRLYSDSPKWNIPARQGLHIAEQVTIEAKDILQRALGSLL